MIAEALRRQLEPVANRSRRLAILNTLALMWFTASLLGIGLLVADWLTGWRSALAIWSLVLGVAALTILAIIRYHRQAPDWHAIARQIELQHPEIRAMLLAAVEQEPTGAGNKFGYLQMRVIMEAISHATTHNWTAAVPGHRMAIAQLMAMAGLLALTAVTSLTVRQVWSEKKGYGILSRAYRVQIEPGNTELEQGSSVAVVARFEGRIPPQVTLVFGPPDGPYVQRPMTRNLNDPVFAVLLERLEQDILYHVEYAEQHSPTFRITTYVHPELERVDARIVYPEYANLPPRHLVDPRLIEVPEGSDLRIELLANKPIATASLMDPNGLSVKLDPLQPGPDGQATRWALDLNAWQARLFQIDLQDAQGRRNRLRQTLTIKVRPNQRPRIRALFPGPDTEVSAIQEVLLEGQVWDDFGIVAYGLGYRIPGAEPNIVTIQSDRKDPQTDRFQYILDLERMGLAADQLITYWFWADDKGSDGTIRRTSSPLYFLEVRPFEWVFYQGTGSGQQQMDQRSDQSGLAGQDQQVIELQKQIISATWMLIQNADQHQSQTTSQDIDVIRQAQQQALQMTVAQAAQAPEPQASTNLQAAAAHMKVAIDYLDAAVEQIVRLNDALGHEQAAYEQLLATRPRQARVVQARDTQRSPQRQTFDRQLQQLQLRFQQDMYQNERMAEPEGPSIEQLQLLERLRQLAQRQGQITDQLREAQASLRQAQDQQRTEQALRQLRRLRDQQIQAMSELDQLQQQMVQPRNRQRMSQAREQLEQVRSRMDQSARQLEQGLVPEAIASATRAQRQLEQVRDQLGQEPSSQLAQRVRDLRSQVQELHGQQQQIADRLQQQISSETRNLQDSQIYRDIADQLDQQSQQTRQVLDRIRQLTDQAEQVEPLVARTLYQAFRQASTERLDQTLNLAGMLLRRDLINQARQVEQQARRSIRQLRQQIEQAAEGLLGDRTNALLAARQGLDRLIGQMEQGRFDPNNVIQDLQAWLEALRQLELVLPQQDLQQQTQAIADRLIAGLKDPARASKRPQWDLLLGQIRGDLIELRRQVLYELARIQPGQELVPVDRDPVPARYAELVRRYFERLGDVNE